MDPIGPFCKLGLGRDFLLRKIGRYESVLKLPVSLFVDVYLIGVIHDTLGFCTLPNELFWKIMFGMCLLY